MFLACVKKNAKHKCSLDVPLNIKGKLFMLSVYYWYSIHSVLLVLNVYAEYGIWLVRLNMDLLELYEDVIS